MNISIIQCDPTAGAYNLRLLEHVLQNIESDLYVLPELFIVGFIAAMSDPQFYETAARTFFPAINRIQGLLWRYRPKATVICGLPEESHDGYYNDAVIIRNNWHGIYRQKNPATARGTRLLPINKGSEDIFELMHLPDEVRQYTDYAKAGLQDSGFLGRYTELPGGERINSRFTEISARASLYSGHVHISSGLQIRDQL